QHLVYEAELAGMILALDIIGAVPRLTRANILLDNKSAISATPARRARPGQQLVELFHTHFQRLKRKRRTLQLRVVWVPGHQGIDGNEWADSEAKAAAEGDSTVLPKALTCLQHLPCSQSALKALYKTRVAEEWKQR
ncbi:hypothetical protein OH77DRAFT_1378841, partial [Trametes cingulata]